MLPPFLAYILTFASTWRYPLLIVGTIVEGPVLMIASGILLRTGIFTLVPLFLVLVIGDLVADIFWYYVGYYFAEPLIRRYGHFFGLSPEKFAVAKELFQRYHTKILLISKVTIGFGMALATLVAAGATRVPFRIYLLLNFIGEVILVAILMSIGYFFGEVYTRISGDLKIAFIIAVIVLAGGATYGFSRYIKNKILAS
jgi:membrane protein DedA with SNARE-associated domain